MKKNKLLILFILFISGLIASTIIIGGSSEGWLGFWGGIVGSMLGVVGAYLVMKTQLDKEKKEKKKEKEPILVFGITSFENLMLNPGYDLINPQQKIKFKNKLSNLSVPLINGGISPIFNIRMIFQLIDHDDMFKIYDKYSETSSKYKMMFKSKKSANQILVGNSWWGVFPKAAHTPVLMSGEQIAIKLPNVYMLTIEYYLLNIYGNIKLTEKKMPLPVLKVKANYEDYELQDRESEFYLVITDENIAFITYPEESKEEIKLNFTITNVNKNDVERFTNSLENV